MKAIVVPRRGGPEVLELREAPDPVPNAAKGEVLVNIEAAGVNFADMMQTQGMYPHGPQPPYIPGLEFAGHIHATKDRVMGFTATGGYAERVAVTKQSLLKIPEAWSAAEAAAFPVNYFTAYFGYWMAGLSDPAVNAKGNKKNRVLIHAVAGGVGTAAVEMGKALGLEIFGTSSSEEKLAKVKALGVHHGINYKANDYEKAIADLTQGEGVDAVFEMLGGEHTAKSTRCLADMGRIIIYGMATGQAPQFDFMTMFQKNISAHALWLTPLTAHRELMVQAWTSMSSYISQGFIRPVVGEQLPLARAADAHRLLLERKNYGKVVLTI
ncbi:MAG: Alcohol dehydrogenase, zinc-binding protein [Acidobacteriales bacterium]|nr:Alcohol dehydrogenase, zinc-binding protein [Terriglobales bacterium]